MEKQLTSASNRGTWLKKSIPFKKLVGSPQNDKNIKYKNREYFFSVPVFNINRNVCLIKYGFYCGIRCGLFEIALFIKDYNNKWKMRGIIFGGIS
jgi:hypothetical protein